MDDLKCCPFCGGDAEFGKIEDPDHHDDGGHFIQCTNGMCAASSRLQFACGDDPKPLLVDAWNRRTPPPLPTREALTAALAVIPTGLRNQAMHLPPAMAKAAADAVIRLLGGDAG